MNVNTSPSSPRKLLLAAIVFVALFWPKSGVAQDASGNPSTAGPPQQSQPDADGIGGKKIQKPSDQSSTKLKIRVTGDKDQPIGNASVYVRFYSSGGFLRHDKLEEMNFKTNQDGSVKVPEIPQGKILVQVIAKGWHTYGKWYDVDKEELAIPIKLDPPPHWY